MLILVVLLIIGAAVAVVAIFVVKTVKAPIDVTNNYIEAINEGNASEVWSLLDSDSPLRQQYTQSSFEQEVVNPSVGELRTWNANEVNVTNNKARVEVDMEFTDGTEFTVSFDLRKDNGDWRVYDYDTL
ncbi:MAG: DUF4878 domain-containing protein [Actinomycetota bacterium]|nr:DUF4878 domain-containing protein [Actinomycetota bacterium]